PCKAELTQSQSAEFNELRSHGRRREGKKNAILPAGDVPPNFLERPRIPPVHRRRARGCPRQITVNKDQRADRNQRSIQKASAREELQTLCPVNDYGNGWKR